MIGMVKRVILKGVRLRYVLADSWFAYKDVIRFIRSCRIKYDYLGMVKVEENGRTKYFLDGKSYTAPALIKYLDIQGKWKYSRRLRCHYIVVDVVFADTKVRLFFVRGSKRDAWNGLMTMDMRLEFLEAYRIYAQRWSLEVVFKEAKGLLGLGKCQANNFTS